MRYQGRRAAIIGGSHGMGLATARLLLTEGAAVLVTGRNEGNLEAALREAGPSLLTAVSDAADLTAIAALAEMIQSHFGQLDLLHVNVGVCELEPYQDVSEASYDRQFAVNTRGAFFTIQRLAPLVADGGAIVLTSSVADEGGEPGMIIYSATKAAIVSFAAGFAAELLPRGIRVNVVSPGFVDTPTKGVAGLSAAERESFKAVGDQVTPMRRNGRPEEVARAVAFLAFEATFTTGAKLPVDGGLGQKLSCPQSAA